MSHATYPVYDMSLHVVFCDISRAFFGTTRKYPRLHLMMRLQINVFGWPSCLRKRGCPSALCERQRFGRSAVAKSRSHNVCSERPTFQCYISATEASSDWKRTYVRFCWFERKMNGRWCTRGGVT